MSALKRLEQFILKAEEWFLFFLLLFMVFLAFAQVILRNVLSCGIVWSDIVVRMGVLYVAIIGASVATSDRAHIRIDLFNRIIPARYTKLLETMVSLVAFLCCLFFLSGSVKFVLVIRNTGSLVNILHLPEWWFAMIFPVGFLFMTIKFFIAFLDDIFTK